MDTSKGIDEFETPEDHKKYCREVALQQLQDEDGPEDEEDFTTTNE